MVRNMDLSVVVFMHLAASGDQLGLHWPANQFLCLPNQTRPVLIEVLPARFVHENRTDFLHQPANPLHQNAKPFPRKDPAPGGHPQLWPLLHVGLASARRLLSKPPKLEATKQHSVGHPRLQHP
jgi:hypothetical protein